MSELNDSSELQLYSAAVLYVMSAVHCPPEYIQTILDHYVNALRSSTVRGPDTPSHTHTQQTI
jgi:proteasome activator subunit 4